MEIKANINIRALKAAEIITRGLVHGPKDILDQLPKSVERVTSWQNGKSEKTWNQVVDTLRRFDFVFTESKLDASHGRRYMLFIYRNDKERAAIWDHIT